MSLDGSVMFVLETKRSFCRICIASCGTLVTIDGDTVVDVHGDPDHPLSQGYLCPKGRALGAMHHDPARLSGSFVRREGMLTAADHRVTVEAAAAAIALVIAEHGPGSVGFFLGSGGFIDPAAAFVARKFRQGLGTDQGYSTATVDSIAKVLVAALMAGTTALVPHLDEFSTLVLMIGSNPVVSHGQSTGFPNPVEWIRRARARGEVYVIDPRRTETARQATHHVAIRPGTDHALLAHLVRDVIQRRGVDVAELELRARGFEELVNAVDRYDADLTAKVTGLAPADLVRLTDAVHTAPRLAVVTGTGTTMSVPGNLVEWLAWSLMILTDSFDRPGGMWFNPGYFTRLDERPTLPATPSTLPSAPSRPSVLNVAGEWPAALIPDEIESGRLRALIVLGAGLTTALPDTDRLRSALGTLDALIVLDILANETTAHATHLFSCHDQLERADVLAMDLYAPARYSHYTDAVVAPGAGRHAAWRVLAEIAAGVGVEVIGKGVDLDSVTTDDVLARVTRGADIAALRALEGAPIMAEKAVYDWVQRRLPNGVWDIAPASLVAQLAAQIESDTATTGPGLVLIPRRQLRRENAHAYRSGETADVWIHPRDAHVRSVIEGALVEVRSSVGRVFVTARVTDAITSGCVSLPHGYAETNVNRLISSADLDSLSGMPRLSGTIVEVTDCALGDGGAGLGAAALGSAVPDTAALGTAVLSGVGAPS